MKELQLNIFEGAIARDEGIKRAADNAEAVCPGWNEQAFKELQSFLQNHHGEFMAEQFRAHCAMVDFPLPPHARSFGPVIVRAVKSGLIRKVGYGQVSNKNAHMANAAIWIANRKAS